MEKSAFPEFINRFWFTFIVNPCSHFLASTGKKVLDPNEPYISTSRSKIRSVCLSVILEFCLSSLSVVCSAFIACPSLCRGLKYSLKVGYIILVYLNVTGFLISNFFFAGSKHPRILGKFWQKMWLKSYSLLAYRFIDN